MIIKQWRSSLAILLFVICIFILRHKYSVGNIQSEIITLGIFLFLLFIACLWIHIKHRIPAELIIISLLIGTVKLLISYFIFVSIISPFPDSFSYVEDVSNFATLNSYRVEDAIFVAQSLHFLFQYYMLIVYKIFGNIFAIVAMNNLLVSISMFYFYKLANREFGGKVALYSFVFMLLSTNIFIFTGTLLKDGIVFFLSIMILYFYKHEKKYILSIILIIMLTLTRIYAGGSLLAAIMIDYLIFNKGLNKHKKSISISILVVFGFIVVPSDLFFNYQVSIMNFLNTKGMDLIVFIPLALIKFIFAPLPWNIVKEINIHTTLITDSIFFGMTSFAFIFVVHKFIKYSWEYKRKVLFYFIPIFIHAVALGAQYGGDSTRQRIGILAIIVMLIFVGFFYREKNVKT